MEDNPRNLLQIDAIRSGLSRIVDEWMQLHFRLAIVFILIALTAEIIFAFFAAESTILTTTISRYIIKFILIPTGLSVLLLLLCRAVMQSPHVSRQTKIYSISFLIVIFCFIYYTAHSAYVAIYALYAFAIFLTATYADFRLTTYVTIASVVSFVISELFLSWDLDKISVFDDQLRMVNFLIGVSIVIVCYIVASVTIQYERKKNETALRKEVERELLKESLQHDDLTGVYNRKALHEALRDLEQNGSEEPLIFGIADIDHFKTFNDVYGHHMGDLCLAEFACILGEFLGETSVYRYGGDEFCLILKNLPLDEVIQRCARIQARFRRVELDNIKNLHPAACFGLTVYKQSDGASGLFNQADEALYEAKKGRNAIRVYGEPVEQAHNRRKTDQLVVKQENES